MRVIITPRQEVFQVVKKIIALADYVTAHVAAQLLTIKNGRPIQPHYVRKLVERKKNPVRAQRVGDRLLYNREDIESTTVKQKQQSEEE
jgi:hypothetical protein